MSSQYYYYPPRWGSSRTVWVLVGLLAVATVILISLFGALATQAAHHHHYSQSEQQFLGKVKSATPSSLSSASGAWAPWPADSELVSEGHQICEILRIHHGDRDAPIQSPIFGRSAVPPWMSNYTYDQGFELVAASVETLCTEYALWIGGVPV